MTKHGFRPWIVGIAVAAAGCGGATGVEPPPGGISGPPPKRPNDDLMQPKGRKAKAKGARATAPASSSFTPGR